METRRARGSIRWGSRWQRLPQGMAVCAAALMLGSCFNAPADPQPAADAPASSPAAATPDASASDSGTSRPDPPPQSGACRRVPAAGLDSIVDNTPTVRCGRRHTTVTFYVGRLPATATRGASTAGRARVERAADRICRREFRDHVGGTVTRRRLSMLRPTYFLPSAEQFGAGARWVRCDAYAYATPDRLAALPPSVEGLLARSEARGLDRCSPVSPSHRRFRHVACRQPHRWRAVATRPLGAPGERYPGLRRAQDRARTRCEAPVRSHLDSTEAFSYGFEVPRRQAWAQGDRLALCWARTST